MEIKKGCHTCKHRKCIATKEPCLSCCLGERSFANWESREENKMNHDEINFATGNMKLLNVEIEVIAGNKYLHFIYDYKDSYKKGDLHLVCYLPTSINYPQFEYNMCNLRGYDTKVKLGLEDLFVKDCRLESIEYNVKEMTIEEIEKQLGHKVKIVGDKG